MAGAASSPGPLDDPGDEVGLTTLAPGVAVHPDHASLLRELDTAPLGLEHVVSWWIASGGTLADGLSVAIIGMALPLAEHQLHLGTVEVALLGAGLVAGAAVGASVGGHLADRVGRTAVMLADMLLLIVAAVASSVAWSAPLLVVAQCGVGIAVGIDFPAGSSYVAETMPQASRAHFLVATIANQAVGMVLGAALVLGLVHEVQTPSVWRFFFGVEALVAAFFLLARLHLVESPRWLMARGRNREALRAMEVFVPSRARAFEGIAARLGDRPLHVARIPHDDKAARFRSIFAPAYRRRTLLTTVPWLLMDIATYGVGLFTPVLLDTLGVRSHSSNLPARTASLALGTGFVDLFLLAGFAVGVVVVARFGRLRMQILGFVGMAIGMGVLLASTQVTISVLRVAFVLVGFVAFNFLMNVGPNSTTYVLPAELFPTQLRSTGSGFAASMAKVGATIGVFLVPVVSAHWGTAAVVGAMVVVSLLGATTTVLWRVDDREQTLEEHQASEPVDTL
ncbi:major facilitator superfamily MFS_1 [Acidimicrobium ferrooxidans DSM 10331]|uniref:Major facilitator superfamily MFS_1 n=1 Tax=Acidimicrobium ferrooxidans (strain DSM 10331 / JCM 15462 / NBRC 103882 / ICP) TaxID=525909 RepID=C7M2R5_ACIFD|nr:MFS transporter [Acidimicrobium ferrooxidans]ACU53309.1 major facilitator superfamily MFS_1 [Acidimicrobium ferrooxidans DSM 10331]